MQILLVLALVLVVGLCVNKYMEKREQDRNDGAADANADLFDRAKEGLYEAESKAQAHVDSAEAKERSDELVPDNSMNMENKQLDEKKGTRDLFLETLTKIGCQYETGEGENDDINFGYQGEYFVVRANNECRYVQIYDTHWGHVELYDIDEFSRLKKAINESNLKNAVTAVYTINEAGSTVDVHCKSVILFTPEIPDIENYLRTELQDYFRVHETVNWEMAKQREKEGNR